MSTLDEEMQRAMLNYRDLKEHNGNDDSIPIIHVVDDEGRTHILAMSIDGHPVDYIPQVLGQWINANPGRHMTVVVFLSDGYTVIATNLPPGGMPRGALHDRFVAGDPAVRECLMVSGIDLEGNFVTMHAPYRVENDGKVVWEDEHDLSPMVGQGGYVQNMLTAVMAATRQMIRMEQD